MTSVGRVSTVVRGVRCGAAICKHGVLISAVLVDTLCEVSSDVIVTVIVVL